VAARGGPEKLERLQKILAQAGLGSRRSCEALVLEGRVTVNGQVVRQLGTKVNPATARIAVDGEPIHRESIVYFAVNKPSGYVSTTFDPAGRPRVVDLLPEIPERIYTVGRLDEESTGLIILTNDGDLANRLAHPRFGVEKMYRALVAGLPNPGTIAKLTEGIWLSDGKVRAKRARVVGRQGQATLLELVLAEGKKREIRRMLSKLGHKVMSLNRVAVGPITLKGLPLGECRRLSRSEIDLLHKAASGIAVPVPRFAESEASYPSRRDVHRPRRRPQEQTRSRRDEARSARDKVGRAREPNVRPRPPQGQASHTGSQPARSNPPRPATSTPPSGPTPRPSHGGKVGAGVPTGNASGPRVESKKPALGSKPPPVASPHVPVQGGLSRRVVIGLGESGPATAGGRTLAGRPAPKRPARRKPRPPRGALGARPGRSSRAEEPSD
jgi:23S rRNA pseudouridine2605 synthase